MRGTSTLARLLALAAVLSVACSLPGSTPIATQTATPDVITPAKGVAVARDYWKTNEQASMHRDAELFARIQTGLLLEEDRAWIIAEQNLNRPALAAPRPLRQVTAYVPRQRGFRPSSSR